MKKTLSVILCIAMLTVLCACGQKQVQPSPSPVIPSVKSAVDVQHYKSYGEIFAAVQKAQSANTAMYSAMKSGAAVNDAVMETSTTAAASTGTAAPSAADGDASSDAGYSQTNVQVAGVDEGDIVKTDGKYIYAIRDRELIIYKPDGASTTVASRTALSSDDSGEYPSELYISGGRLAVVMESGGIYYALDGAAAKSTVMPSTYKDSCSVAVYDVSEPTAPKLVTTLGQDGSLLTSRLLDGKLYLVTNYGAYYATPVENNPATFVPCTYKDGAASAMPAEDIAAVPDTDSASYAVVCAYDIQSAANTGSVSILGGGDTVYMNAETLYLARSEYKDTASGERTQGVYTVVDHANSSSTSITAVTLAGLAVRSSGTIPGSLYGSYALDEYQGYLRAATTDSSYTYSIYTDKSMGFENYKDGGSKQTNAIYVLDSGMNVAGKAEGIAQGETIYSVRYDGPIAYMCTYEQTDPLFAYDLSNPASPVKLGELKITGFSQYLHVWTDGRLFGLGQSAAEDGQVTGMKMVMFDTSDKAKVSALKSLELGQGYSEALYDYNAILIDYDKNLIGFPTDSGYALYSYSDAAGFTQLAKIAGDDWGYNMRGLYIGDYLYIVMQNGLTVISMGDYSTVGSVKV